MQYQVPQFIEIEDKIFGPFTFKQFLYLVGGGGISFVVWQLLPTFVAFLIAIPIIILSVALAFYKKNNRPFIALLESMFKYSLGGKLYVWKKEPKKAARTQAMEKKEIESLSLPRLSDSKLKDISWSLGVKDSLYAEEVGSKKTEF